MSVVEQLCVFLEKQPLYAKVALDLSIFANLPHPDVLELECRECGQSRPFREHRLRQTGPGFGTGGRASLTSGVYDFVYECTGCSSALWRCWVEVNTEDWWIRKVGQLPPWSIAVSKDLERHLGAAADHYKLALICMSQSYGLGACAYMRRVLEDTIDSLLRLELEVKQGESAAKEELAAISAAIAGKVFDKKTEMAYRHAPRSIVVDGNNPLKLIHDQLSIGVHQLPEEECLAVAVKLSTALEYVVTELNRQREAKAAFTAAIRVAAEGPAGERR